MRPIRATGHDRAFSLTREDYRTPAGAVVEEGRWYGYEFTDTENGQRHRLLTEACDSRDQVEELLRG